MASKPLPLATTSILGQPPSRLSTLDQFLRDQLEDLERRNLYRTRQVVESPQAVFLTIDGSRLLNFCSNDYLGLANHPDVVAAMRRAAAEFGVGSGAAHLVCGHGRTHHALEEELADFTGRDKVLLFSTGYMANLGVISALVGREDSIFEDKLNHASLLDGGLLSRAKFRRYPHADLAALKSSLESRAGHKLIVCDGVFSMDGDLAPLPKLVALAQEMSAWSMVDDAHGLGVLGKTGRGTLEHFQLDPQCVDVLVGTLGKAFGTFGAFVAGSNELIEFLIQKARPYIYTTAMPPAVAEATRASLRIIQREPWRREKLSGLIERFRSGAEQLGLALLPSSTPIQPLLVGDSRAALSLGRKLQRQGVLVTPIRPPTVPEGRSRLRVTLSAAHEEEHVDCLLDALAASVAGKPDV